MFKIKKIYKSAKAYLIRVQMLTRSIPYLIKQLKRSGFQEPILISVYRSLALSHITYSAAILTSTSANIKNEMEHFHKTKGFLESLTSRLQTLNSSTT